MQDLVRIVLGRVGGYEMHVVADGLAALAVAPRCTPELLLLDLELPGMNGIATLRALRELPGLRQIPAVFLTGAKDLELGDELRALGVCQVLHKPIRPRALLETIERALSARA